jgi:two-component system, NtrC family, sensor kinase
MTDMRYESRDSRNGFYSSLWLPVLLLGGLLVITLVMEFILTWQSHERLQPINRHIMQMAKLQGANIELQRELVESLRGQGEFSIQERKEMGQELTSILEAHALLSKDSPALISAAHDALVNAARRPKEALILTLSETRKAIDLEAREHKALVGKINRATALELRIGAIALVVFPGGAILLLYLMRRRILAPLEHLSFLMTLLARSDYTQAPLKSVDPMLLPLTQNYNAMVARLAELEAEHAQREKSLESQVDNATQVLLEQQRNLANAERLAAVGEMMARIAHELRNPLAGVKMACTNLRNELAEELPDKDYTERVNIVAVEIDRIIAVLNAMLDQSRHSPEPLSRVNIGQAVADLLTLVRYQIPGRITLSQDIPDALVCRLPDAMLRQALLNLLLNAQQAIGDNEGSIIVRAHNDDDKLQLLVCDDGPGFSEDMLETGIRAFVSHRPDGTGLGLSMVQRFARAQGGGVKLSNHKPHGACVTLELPCGNKDV